MQSRVINNELSMIGHEVLKATEQHRKKKPYSPPQQLVTPAVKFLGGILDGTARLSMVITLSSADQYGWETWFSLQYGTDLSKLCVPVTRQTPQPLDKCFQAAQAKAEKSAKEFEASPQNKYYFIRRAKAEAAADVVRKLEMVMI